MRFKQKARFRAVIGLLILFIGSLSFSAMFTSTPSVYITLLLGMISFWLVDYFAALFIASLLCIIVASIYPGDTTAFTRILMICAIWLSAMVATIFKLIKQPHRFPVELPVTPELTNHQPHNIPFDKLPMNLRHDLRTPINLIIGFCDAIFRAMRTESQNVPHLYSENVEAIYRNAKQLEKLTNELIPTSPEQVSGIKEEIDPAILINATVDLLQALIATNSITLDLRLDTALPKLSLHHMYLRQALLNILRMLILSQAEAGDENVLSLEARCKNRAFTITISASSPRIDRVVANSLWDRNLYLVEMNSGYLFVEKGVGNRSEIILSFPLPPDLSEAVVQLSPKESAQRRNIVVVADNTTTIDLFKQHINQHNVIGVYDVESLREMNNQPATVVLTDEENADQLKAVCDMLDVDVPIVICAIPTIQHQIDALRARYLPKPVNYDALLMALANTGFPIQHILIVDDNLDSAEMLVRMLTSMSDGYLASKAYTGGEALALLRRQPIDAIIVDISLPDMDGLTLVQHIRANDGYAHVPIVVISAHQNLDAMLPSLIPYKVAIVQSRRIEPTNLVVQTSSLIDSLIRATAHADD